MNVDARSSGIWALLTSNPRFALLWLGQTLSRLGNYVYAAGIGVLAYQVSGSGAGVALTLGAFSVVQLVFVFLARVWAESLASTTSQCSCSHQFPIPLREQRQAG